MHSRDFSYSILIIIILIFFSQRSDADNYHNYPSNLIPEELISKADVVIRNKTINVIWNEIDELIVRKNIVVTIMNKDGLKKARFYELYDNDTEIKKLNATVLDKFGNKIKEYKKSKFQDRAVVSGLYTDSRYKYLEPISNSFPFTIIYSSETKSSNSLNFPYWKPLRNNYTAVEKSEFIFSNPKDLKFNVYQRNTSAKVSNNGDLVWSVKNEKASTPESYSSSKIEHTPYVEIAPEEFIYEGIKGRFSNWKEYGDWFYHNLIKQQSNLTQKQKNEIIDLVDADDTDLEKAKKVYTHLQDKMRYVSVQVGIGGIQPISAKDVAECGYGDCKGLTNYTMAALDAIDIESIYTEVKSGRVKYNFNDNFASVVQGDHIILCLPNVDKDTLWLECTSKDTPFGYLGDFTDDRRALLITPEGGKITRTPDYSEFSNSISKKIDAKIDPSGEIRGTSECKLAGNKYLDHIFVASLSDKNKQVALNEIYSNNMLVSKVEYVKTDSLLNIETIEFSIPNEDILLSGKSFVFNPYILKNRLIKLYRNRSRISDIVIQRDHIEEDTIIYKLPKQSKIEAIPNNVFIDNAFATYIREISIEGNSLTYYRRFVLKKGKQPKENYNEFYKFIRKVKKNDNSKVMIYL